MFTAAEPSYRDLYRALEHASTQKVISGREASPRCTLFPPPMLTAAVKWKHKSTDTLPVLHPPHQTGQSQLVVSLVSTQLPRG
ncbi:hypothetical protein C8Q73DRAFT_686422 [Cubamyces lactineus]|nr:hypothetical protein C8Q73DRAFT_686422 [Cubamyces lactineus]